MVDKSGVTVMGVKGSGWLFQTAKVKGLNKEEFVVWFGVDEESGCVGIYTEAPGYPESTMIRVKRGGKAVQLHLGPVFEEHPDLRPSVKVDAMCTLERDDQGREVVSIQLRGAIPHIAIARDTSSRKPKQNN